MEYPLYFRTLTAAHYYCLSHSRGRQCAVRVMDWENKKLVTLYWTTSNELTFKDTRKMVERKKNGTASNSL